MLPKLGVYSLLLGGEIPWPETGLGSARDEHGRNPLFGIRNSWSCHAGHAINFHDRALELL